MLNLFRFLLHNKRLFNSIAYAFLFVIVVATQSQCLYAQTKSAPDFTDYLNKIEKAVKTNWHPPKEKSSKCAQVFFTIDKKGNVPNVKITCSTENAAMDKSALKAVIDSQPFPTPPGNESISVNFTFDYNAHGQSTDKQGKSLQRMGRSLFADPKNPKKPNDNFIWIFGVFYILLLIYRNFARLRRLNKDKEEVFVSAKDSIDKDKSKEGILD